ncbi:unnamed protein product [Urochloa decumbens]|uniref:RRM domain-containing protein n=1 Tax=Urochloa decumbens TaxID=240449 RepID=A0ABC9F3E9_9POAL
MPTEQRRHMPPAHFLPAESESPLLTDELRLRPERQVGLLKQGCFPEHVGRFACSPLQKLKPIGAAVVNQLDIMQPYKLMDQKAPFGLDDKLLDQRNVNLPPSSWRADQDHVRQRDSFLKPLVSPLEGRRGSLNGTQYESGLFSSSLPDIFDKKIRLTPKTSVVDQPVEKINVNQADDEPFEMTKEIETQIIGNLLPDDDDLLSGVLGDVGYDTQGNNQDDIEDDIFCTGGGMELEADGNNKLSKVNGGVNYSHTRSNVQLNGEYTYGEQPSRILFVRNIDSNIDDSELKFIFEQYGDIHTLDASCKHHGFVIVSYYDIRSAENALRALHNKPLRRRKLDMQYFAPKDYHLEKNINQGTLILNLDPSITNDDLCRIFGVYGEIKEICNTSDNDCRKSMEFFDLRASESARYALNRSAIAGNKIKLEPSCLGDTKRLMQQMSHVLDQERFGVCKLGSPNSPSSTFFGSVNMASIRSTGPESGTVQVLRSRVQTPMSQFREGRNFLDLPSTTIPSRSSPVGIATAGSESSHHAFDEHCHSIGKMNGQKNERMGHGFHESSAFHPHSLPEFNDKLSNGVPYNFSIPSVGVKSNVRATEAMEGRYIYKGSSGNCSNQFSTHAEAPGFSRIGSCTLHDHHLAQSNSNNLQRQLPSPMLWSSTGPFINNIPSRPLIQLHRISRAPLRMLEKAVPVIHVGSAPAVNPSILDRQCGYAGELMEAPGFHPRGAGSMGFPGSAHLHQLETNGMHNGRTFMDPAISPSHTSAPSPKQRGHMFRRSHMALIPSSFDSAGERMRSRRNESNVNQSDNKRLFELDIERIIRGEDSRTTLMIKNIPNKYTSKMLLAAIDESHRGIYDFIYLPIDFKNKCNVGYAFINMISSENIVPFYKTFHGKRWEKFNSEKVASLAYARIQGKSALVAHFQNSSLMNEDKRCRPILFHSDGPNAGDQEPFPVGPNVRSRPGRSRILSWEQNHQDVLSDHAKGRTAKRGAETPAHIARDSDPTSITS